LRRRGRFPRTATASLGPRSPIRCRPVARPARAPTPGRRGLAGRRGRDPAGPDFPPGADEAEGDGPAADRQRGQPGLADAGGQGVAGEVLVDAEREAEGPGQPGDAVRQWQQKGGVGSSLPPAHQRRASVDGHLGLPATGTGAGVLPPVADGGHGPEDPTQHDDPLGEHCPVELDEDEQEPVGQVLQQADVGDHQEHRDREAPGNGEQHPPPATVAGRPAHRPRHDRARRAPSDHDQSGGLGRDGDQDRAHGRALGVSLAERESRGACRPRERKRPVEYRPGHGGVGWPSRPPPPPARHHRRSCRCLGHHRSSVARAEVRSGQPPELADRQGREHHGEGGGPGQRLEHRREHRAAEQQAAEGVGGHGDRVDVDEGL
jgi:hypothetical protein